MRAKLKTDCSISRRRIWRSRIASLLTAMARADEKVTYRDSMGRIQGTEQTDRYGKTTRRDAMGRIQGTKR